jgi:hypothetical protein
VATGHDFHFEGSNAYSRSISRNSSTAAGGYVLRYKWRAARYSEEQPLHVIFGVPMFRQSLMQDSVCSFLVRPFMYHRRAEKSADEMVKMGWIMKQDDWLERFDALLDGMESKAYRLLRITQLLTFRGGQPTRPFFICRWMETRDKERPVRESRDEVLESLPLYIIGAILAAWLLH